jgi:hypothetical protein
MRRSVPSGQQTPAAFIRTFRRRSLLVSALRIAFLAALVNEGLRWMAVGAREWLGAPVPVLSTGPLFFLTACIFTFRRFSLTAAAARADKVLSFQDRLTSLMDFSRRRDIPRFIVHAQAGEVAAALKGVSPEKARPIPLILLAGPLLLCFSVFYPNLMNMAPYIPPVEWTLTWRQAGLQPGTSPEESSPVPAGHSIPGKTEPESSAERTPSGTDGASPPAERSRDAVSLEGASSGPGIGEGGGREHTRTGAHREGSMGPKGELFSQRVGESLSPVVNPLYSSRPVRREEREKKLEGAMSFRIFPEAAAGKDGSTGRASTESRPNRIIVNFDEIPEQYRPIVEKYFVLLGQEETSRESPDQANTGHGVER